MLISSVGSETTFLFFPLLLKATARDIGPILPKYIVAMTTILPIALRLAVKFLESPTVAVALTHSYMTSNAEAFVHNNRSTIELSITTTNVTTTATALRIASLEIVRLKRGLSFVSYGCKRRA